MVYCGTSAKTNVCPDPVWKPVSPSPAGPPANGWGVVWTCVRGNRGGPKEWGSYATTGYTSWYKQQRRDVFEPSTDNLVTKPEHTTMTGR